MRIISEAELAGRETAIYTPNRRYSGGLRIVRLAVFAVAVIAAVIVVRGIH